MNGLVKIFRQNEGINQFAIMDVDDEQLLRFEVFR